MYHLRLNGECLCKRKLYSQIPASPFNGIQCDDPSLEVMRSMANRLQDRCPSDQVTIHRGECPNGRRITRVCAKDHNWIDSLPPEKRRRYRSEKGVTRIKREPVSKVKE